MGLTATELEQKLTNIGVVPTRQKPSRRETKNPFRICRLVRDCSRGNVSRVTSPLLVSEALAMADETADQRQEQPVRLHRIEGIAPVPLDAGDGTGS